MAIVPTSANSIPEEGLERFAYVASHDMAEPLRMVSGYLDLIRESYGDQLDADFEEFVDSLWTASSACTATSRLCAPTPGSADSRTIRSRSTFTSSSTRPCAGCDRRSRRPAHASR